MATLITVWMAALLGVVALSATGLATGNESLMLVTFFASKALWLAYLWLLFECALRYRGRSHSFGRARRNDRRRVASV